MWQPGCAPRCVDAREKWDAKEEGNKRHSPDFLRYDQFTPLNYLQLELARISIILVFFRSELIYAFEGVKER
jgi:hypothetical protein